MTTMDIKELLNRTDRFAANAGCRITEVDEQHAEAEMTVTAMHLNGGNVCQGGALFTLADLAIAAWMNYNGQQQDAGTGSCTELGCGTSHAAEPNAYNSTEIENVIRIYGRKEY